MAVYIGVDFHPYEQSVALADDGDGEIGYRRFLHSDKQSIKAFYRKWGEDAVIGLEATGCLWWFEKLLASNGQQLKMGDPTMIRRAALSRHKNDFRDAETILDLLMRGQFPSIVPRSAERGEPRSAGPLALRAVIGEKANVDCQSAAGFRAEQGLAKFHMSAAKTREEA